VFLGVVGPTPAGRLGEPEEIDHLAAFLASPAASFITGVATPATGGATGAPVKGLDRRAAPAEDGRPERPAPEAARSHSAAQLLA
jgi:hypothetical protein